MRRGGRWGRQCIRRLKRSWGSRSKETGWVRNLQELVSSSRSKCNLHKGKYLGVWEMGSDNVWGSAEPRVEPMEGALGAQDADGPDLPPA